MFATCFLLPGLSLLGLTDEAATASTTGSPGFTLTLAEPSVPYVFPGGRLEYHFEFTNGGSVTPSPFTASVGVPEGTTLVSDSQWCGGGDCTPTFTGTALQWSVPAGAQAGSVYTMSFAVYVSTDNAPPSLSTDLSASGPGCPSSIGCTSPVPTVRVMPLPVMAASSPDPGISEAPSTTTTDPSNDNQNLVVEAPKCSKVGKKIKCHSSHHGKPGEGSQGQQGSPRGNGAGSAGGHGLLAATGDDEVGGIRVAALALLVGAILVGAARRRNTQI